MIVFVLAVSLAVCRSQGQKWTPGGMHVTVQISKSTAISGIIHDFFLISVLIAHNETWISLPTHLLCMPAC